MSKSVTYIDIRPTWSGIVPALVEMIERGTDEARNVAITELTRMAKLADERFAQLKAEDAKNV